MIDNEAAWSIMRFSAIKLRLTNTTYESLVKNREYRIIQVSDSVIGIERSTGGEDCELTKAAAIAAIERLRFAGGEVTRGKLIETVALETAFVLLCPLSGWSDDKSRIIYSAV